MIDMKLKKIINTNLNINIKGIKTNSKDIKKGDIFVCCLGLVNKNAFIFDAIKKGCSAIITDKNIKEDIPYIKVDNVSLVLKDMLDKYYNYPLKNTNLIGITGTDGKTTTVSIIRNMLNASSIGTNGVEFKNKIIELKNTTPSLDKLYDCFNLIKKNSINDIVLEVSSESYLTNRIPYLNFNIGIFTNITKEHLDKHKDFDDYFNCKMQLLKNSNIAIVNRDSKYFKKIIKYNNNYVTYGKKKSDITIKKYQLYNDKTIIWFKYKKIKYKIKSPLVGEFNVYNLMSAILCLLCLKYEINDILKRIPLIKQVRGRIEVICDNPFKVIIDHAHTINATLNILKFIRKHTKGKIITVLGCAGKRYKEKREIIGKYALKYSNIALFTMDDPRDENVNDIINDMLSKTRRKNYYKIIDRKEAIRLALKMAKRDDVVLILGRGRDNYMAINDQYVEYSDVDIIKKYLTNLDVI